MTTEHTNLQQSDVDKAVVEQQPVSETIPNLLSPEVIVPAEAQTDQHDQGQSQQQQNPTMNRGSTEVRDGSSPIYPGSTFSFTEAMPLVEADVARPFTDFIEEFRQAEEARLSSSLREPTGEPFSVGEPAGFIVEADQRHQDEMAGQTVQASVSHEQAKEQAPDDTSAGTAVNTTGDTAGEQKPTLAESAAPVRPVSPLLRPASRLRLPRHGAAAGRQREEQPVTEKAQMVPAPETASSGEQPRPARRYRFDRPVASNAPIPLQSRSEEGKDTASRSLPLTPASARADSGSTPGKEVKEGNGQAKHSVTQSAEQEQTAAPVPPAATPEAEVVAPTTVPPTTEVALEDLPPLEYSELQRASSRRRRRRRSGDTTSTVTATPTPTPVPATPTANAASTTKPAIPEPLATPGQTPAVTTPRSVTPLPGTAPTTVNQYNIVSGYTVSQMNQGNGGDGPFMSPEPSPARGSTPVRGNLRAVRAEAQRTTVYPVRTGDPALNQIANAVVQSIQAQTDRMVNELRRTNQVPANISVSLPQFPSTERVGVFVDVANLLYSARTLRITIDFAKLLDFLRGNRRLVRAQAYCPTSPHSSEDQMFLQAVKGLGYRITTKNYKTFSSGAKKADLDLDLCMDVVRLVDGKAVDSIVLVSGDSDFMPMLDYCSDHGVRVEVAAFDEAMSATLRQSCDLFINLAMLEEIRA